MASAAVTSKKTKSPTANKNYSTNLASGGSVTVKNGVKTYSDKPLQVKGKGGISISGQSYSRDKGGTGYAPITSESIKPTEKINLPTKPQGEDLTTLTNSINTALATGSGGMYTYEQGKGLVSTPQPTAEPTAMSNFNQMMQALGANYENNSFDAEANTRAMQKELRPYEKAVSSYQNQINQIVAKRDADQLKLEGQGRGITDTIIGGQQAKIGREAAIQALPIQAQLAAAQDDLESARTYVSQLYTAKQADAQARYQYEANKIQAIYGFLTAEEAKVARAKELEQSRAWQVEDRNITLASNLAQTAMEYGQSSLAGKIMALDEKSLTFTQDYAALQGQLRKPVAGAASGWEIKDVNGTSMWVNKNTLETRPVDGGASPQALQKSETLNDIEKILQYSNNQLQESLGKRNIIQRNIPGTVENQFSIQHSNLINQLALAARGELKGQGQVSDYEGKLLKSAQTTLNLYMSPDEYRKEAKQVAGAIKTSSGIPAYVSVKSPEGQTRYAVLGSSEIQEAVNSGYLVEYQ